MLQKFRKKIDELDLKIIKLIKQRSDIVGQVREYKKSVIPKGESFIKSGREADMVRQIVQNDFGLFPRSAASFLWRLIINASLNIEHNLTIAVLNRKLSDNYWYGREYFSPFTKIYEYDSLDKLLDGIYRNDFEVAVLNSDIESWCEHIKSPLQIFGVLPYSLSVNDTNEIKAYLVANIRPEKTISDTTVIKINNIIDETIFEEIKLSNNINRNFAKILKLNGYYGYSDDLLKKLESCASFVILGYYSNQFRL